MFQFACAETSGFCFVVVVFLKKKKNLNEISRPGLEHANVGVTRSQCISI